jgi:hypothetical protein
VLRNLFGCVGSQPFMASARFMMDGANFCVHAMICFGVKSGIHSERIARGERQLRDIGDYHQDQHAKSGHCYDRSDDKTRGIEFRHYIATSRRVPYQLA